jgi:serine/threonine protein kinase
MGDSTNPSGERQIDPGLNEQFSQNEFEETVDFQHGDSSIELSELSRGGTEAPGIPKSIGKYDIQRILGKGAFGAVYLGIDTLLERKVAIKVPLLEKPDAEFEKQFLAEARQLAQLTHPGIVTVFDVSSDEVLEKTLSTLTSGSQLAGLSKGYFRQVGKLVDSPWLLASNSDFLYPETTGSRPFGTAFLNWYIVRVFALCASNKRVLQTFTEVLHFIKKTTALFHPAIVLSVLKRCLGFRDKSKESKTRPGIV